MANSLYQQLNPSVQQSNPLVNAFKALKNSKNPMQLLTNMASQNPQVKQTLEMINSSGQSPKDLFYAMAKQKGVDPNQILSMLN